MLNSHEMLGAQKEGEGGKGRGMEKGLGGNWRRGGREKDKHRVEKGHSSLEY